MTVAALIIGNEVLSAKVTEANGSLLIQRCRALGIAIVSVHLVPDEIDAVVEALMLARRRARWVLTSGGIGPTHDDLTVRAVALSLGRAVVQLPDMAALIERAYEGQVPPAAAMRLSEGPAGSRLLYSPELHYPVLACDNVFMLPGVPQLFRLQLEVVLRDLPQDRLALRTLYLNASESDIASVLDAVALDRPDVAIGSYPTFDPAHDYRVKVTVEHRHADQVSQVVERLTRELPPGSVLRVGDD